MRRFVQTLVALCLAIAVLLMTPAAYGAAPRIILIEGPGLATPIVLDDWQDNHRLLLGLRDINGETPPLSGRPYLDLKMFWGPEVDAFITGGGDPIRLKEDELGGRQDARLYLATNAAKLVLYYAGSLRELTPEAQAVLEERGVPLQASAVETDRRSRTGLWWIALATAAGLALTLAAGRRILTGRSQESSS